MTIEIKDLRFSFTPERIILDNISLSLDQGKIYALMGANGSGKTTLFNIITGFIRQQSGEVIINGTNISKFSPYKRNRAGVSRTFQDLRLIGNLTVQENINIAFQNKLSDKWYNVLFPNKLVKDQESKLDIRATEILEQFHLTEVRSNLASEISYGQQKLLNIACCVANDSQVLLLDEPVAGVNPVYRDQLTEILQQLKKNGKTILLIEHNTEFIDQVADYIFFISNGKLKEYSDLETMKQDNEVLKAYM